MFFMNIDFENNASYNEKSYNKYYYPKTYYHCTTLFKFFIFCLFLSLPLFYGNFPIYLNSLIFSNLLNN